MDKKAISMQDLEMEVHMALKDYFVAQVSRENDKTLLRFANGQTFELTMTERK